MIEDDMTNTTNTAGIDLDWVSVKDRMPKLIPIGDPPHEFVACSARVLVCGWADKEFHWSVADLRRGGRGIEDRAVRWNTDADVFWHRDHLITHWAPLSKPGEASATNGAPVSAPIDAVIVHKSTAVGWTELPRPPAANTDDLLAALRAFGVTYDDEIPYNAGWFAAGSCMARTTAAEAAEIALEMIEERYDILQRDYDTVKCQVDRAYNDGLADLDKWARGYFCAVGVALREDGDTTIVRSLFAQGGDPTRADPLDVELFIEGGLLDRAALAAGRQGNAS
jgi:hypothetical protein